MKSTKRKTLITIITLLLSISISISYASRDGKDPAFQSLSGSSVLLGASHPIQTGSELDQFSFRYTVELYRSHIGRNDHTSNRDQAMTLGIDINGPDWEQQIDIKLEEFIRRAIILDISTESFSTVRELVTLVSTSHEHLWRVAKRELKIEDAITLDDLDLIKRLSVETNRNELNQIVNILKIDNPESFTIPILARKITDGHMQLEADIIELGLTKEEWELCDLCTRDLVQRYTPTFDIFKQTVFRDLGIADTFTLNAAELREKVQAKYADLTAIAGLLGIDCQPDQWWQSNSVVQQIPTKRSIGAMN